MKIKSALCALLLLAVFSACASSSDYDNNVSNDEIISRLTNDDDFSSLSAADGQYMKLAMDIEPDDFDCAIVLLSGSSTSIDEFGVFRAKKDDLPSAEIKIREYLNMRRESWNPAYLSSEFPKLSSAEVRTFGSYVVYAISDEDSRSEFYDELQDIIEK